ncbi:MULTISPECIES: biotin transporter BioY [unclassified Actinomyces]|uniref:biotin transporter BioY n=1 Tax=unclassified Actinomyces TaxID=2609248 RepID=UPI0013A706FC|nr:MULTISPECIES: biotin transporter BioY [unclassified Actinomyces]MBW3069519.1 biotin transporter BioY [Actinomyces sp. 594]NDR53488.1 biotin transporter BioY [Actinomyces sp. 565]
MSTNMRPAASLEATPATAVPLIRRVAREAALIVGGAAAIALIGQVALPLPFTPVPVTLGTLAALGVGGVLGSRRGLAAVALFAAAAAFGAPVLAGWNGGVTASFGYVLGYGLAALLAGRAGAVLVDRGAGAAALRAMALRVGLMLAASALVYVPGLVWLHAATGASWGVTVSLGLMPFIVGDLLKSLVAALLPRPAALR